MLSVGGQAARMTGLGKTTIARSIKAGRLSAARTDTGSYEIDAAELARVYPVRPEGEANGERLRIPARRRTTRLPLKPRYGYL